MSMSITCDICGDTRKNSYADLYPREMSLVAEYKRVPVFMPQESEVKTIDICPACYDKLRVGVRGVIQEIKGD